MHHSCSRAAANACATHLRLLTEPSRLLVLPQIPKALRGRSSSTVRPSYNCLPVPNTCLPISFLVLNDHSLRIRGCSGLPTPPFPTARRHPLSRKGGDRNLPISSQSIGVHARADPVFPRSRHPRPSNLWEHGGNTPRSIPTSNSHKRGVLKPTNNPHRHPGKPVLTCGGMESKR